MRAKFMLLMYRTKRDLVKQFFVKFAVFSNTAEPVC
jgi:hypothetical protein